MAWFFVAMIAEVLWVSSNLLDKFLLHRYFNDAEDEGGGPGTLLIFSGLFGGAVAVFVFALTLFTPTVSVSIGTMGVLGALGNGFLALLGVGLYLYALERAEMSRVIPIFQVVPFFGLALGYIALGETLTLTQMLYGAVTIGGALLLLVHFNGKRGDPILKRLGLDWVTLVLMLGASLAMAGTDTLFKVVALEENYWATVFWTSTGTFITALGLFTFVPGYRRQFIRLCRHKTAPVFGLNILNEVLVNAGNYTFAAAFMLAPIALVQVTNAFQPLLILLFAVIATWCRSKIYKEDMTGGSITQKLLGITLVMGGSTGILLL